MGNKIDKMDDSLMQYAPLDKEVIQNVYFIYDAFRYMDLISLACESIIRPNNEIRGRTSSLEDFGMILKSAGKQLGRQGTFAKILIAAGELEILIGKMENMWSYDIDELLVKPIKKCICFDSEELTKKRNQIMVIRNKLRDAKMNNQQDVESLEQEYKSFQDEFKDRLLNEKRIITDFSKNLTKVLEKQLEMNQNSTIHLETLVDLLKKSPKKIQISRDSSSESLNSEGIHKKNVKINPGTASSNTAKNVVLLPDFTRERNKSKKFFDNYIAMKLANIPSLKPLNPSR